MMSLPQLGSTRLSPDTGLGALLKTGPYVAVSAVVVLLGFFRELVIAGEFGLGRSLDVYVAVLSIHALLGVQLGVVLEQVYLARASEQPGSAASVRTGLQLSSFALLANLLGALVLQLGGAELIGWIFSGFDSQQIALAVDLLPLLLAASLVTALFGLVRAVLATHGRFLLGLAGGGIASLAVLGVVWVRSPETTVAELATSLLVGWTLALAMAVVISRQLQLERPAAALISGVGSLAGAVGWLFVGELLVQTSFVWVRSLASTLAPGAMSAWFVAYALITVFAAVLVLPVSTLLQPRIVRLSGAAPSDARQLVLRTGAALSLLGFAVMLLWIWLAEPVLELLFRFGRVGPEGIAVISEVLLVLVWTLPVVGLTRLLRNALQALQDFRSPVLAPVLQLLILALFGGSVIAAEGLAGLAALFVLGQWATSGLLLWIWHRRLSERRA